MKKKVLLSLIFVLITTLMLFSTCAFAAYWTDPYCPVYGDAGHNAMPQWDSYGYHIYICDGCSEPAASGPEAHGSWSWVTGGYGHYKKCTTCKGYVESAPVKHGFKASTWKCVCGVQLELTNENNPTGAGSLLPTSAYQTTESGVEGSISDQVVFTFNYEPRNEAGNPLVPSGSFKKYTHGDASFHYQQYLNSAGEHDSYSVFAGAIIGKDFSDWGKYMGSCSIPFPSDLSASLSSSISDNSLIVTGWPNTDHVYISSFALQGRPIGSISNKLYTRGTGNHASGTIPTTYSATVEYKDIYTNQRITATGLTNPDDVNIPSGGTSVEKEAITGYRYHGVSMGTNLTYKDDDTQTTWPLTTSDDGKTVTFWYDKEANLTVHYYIKDTTEQLSGDTVQTLIYGEHYDTEQYDFSPNYVFDSVSGDPVSGDVDKDSIEVIYYYTEYSPEFYVTVYYKDVLSGADVKNSEVIEIPATGMQTISKADIDGYAYHGITIFGNEDYKDDKTYTEQQVDSSDNTKEIIFWYDKEANLTVHYYKKDTTDSVSPDFEDTVLYGGTYETEQRDLSPEYVFDSTSGDSVSGDVDKDEIVVIYYYTDYIPDYYVTVHYLDIHDESPLRASRVIEIPNGGSTNVEKMEFDGYAYHGITIFGNDASKNDNSVEGHECYPADSGKEIIFWYDKEAVVITQYLDKETGDPIAPLDEDDYLYDEHYDTEESPDIPEYYEFDSNSGDPVSGDVDKDEIVVIYYYTLKDYEYTVLYYELNTTNPVHDPKSGDAQYNSRINAADEEAAVTINDYTYHSCDPDYIDIGTNPADNVIILYYTPIEYSCTVQHKNIYNGNDIVPPEEVAIDKDNGAELNSEDFNGYTYHGVSKGTNDTHKDDNTYTTVVVSKDDDGITITFWYDKSAVVITEYLDKETGDPIDNPDEDNTKIYGDPYETNDDDADIPEYYEFDSNSGDPVSGDVDKDEIVVIYYYKLKNYEYTVLYYELNTTNPVHDPKSGDAEYDSTIYAADEEAAVTIDDYSYHSCDPDYINIDTNPANNVIILYYVPMEYSCKVEHKNIFDGQDIVPPAQVAIDKDNGAELNSEDFNGFVYHGVTVGTDETNKDNNTYTTVDVTKDDDGITVTFWYDKEATVTTEYLDKETGDPIAPPDEDDYLYDEHYDTEESPDIPDYYEFDSNSGDPVSGDVDKDEIVVIYYYKLKEYKYTVNYLELGTTNVLHDPEEKTAPYGSTINSSDEVIEIDKFEYDSVEDDQIIIQVDPEQNIVTIYYTRKPIEVHIYYMDEDTLVELISGETIVVDDPETINYEDITDYEYNGVQKGSGDKSEPEITYTEVVKEDGSIDIIFWYKRQAKLVAHYYLVDEDGNFTEVPVADDVNETHKYGDDYVTDEATLNEEYELVCTSGDPVDGTVDKAEVEVIYYYRLKTYTYTVNFLEKGTDKVLADPKQSQTPYNREIHSIDEVIEIAKYLYDSADIEILVTTRNPEENIINIYYKKAPTGGSSSPKGKVVVKYLIEGTDEPLTPDESSKGSIGSSYKTDTKGFEGYVLVAMPDNSKGTYKKDEQTVIYYYKKAPNYDLTIDDDGHHEWYLRGYEDYTFRMTGNVTREEVATIFYRLTMSAEHDMRQDYKVTEKPFEDTELDIWSIRAIAYMKELGIMKGYEDGTFRPKQPITRAEFAQVIRRYIKEPKKNATMFTDLTADHWANEAITYAANEGWIVGYEDGTFQPDKYISRVETVTIINRMLKRGIEEKQVPEIEIPVVDLDPTHWGYANVLEAITKHDYEKNADGTEHWTDYGYPFHEDMSQEAYNDI